MSTSYTIKAMSLQDLAQALAWARAEGWNPGLDDAAAFYAADPSGFLMGWLDGEPVGCIAVVKYGAAFAFLGLYIVRPAYRGKGLGKAIWDAGMASAGTRSIGLDGVLAQQANYRASGFAFAHRNIRYGGAPARPRSPRLSPSIVPADGPVRDAILAYDGPLFPAARRSFLQAWLAPSPHRHSLAWHENGVVRGYGTIRACAEGHKIGPLFADSETVAEAILEGLIAAAEPASLFMDVPEANPGALRLAGQADLAPVFETARMYRGPSPELPLGQIFAMTTLELG